MDHIEPNDFEVLKWLLTILAGAFGGIFTVAIATSRRINQLDNLSADVAGIKRILFREAGGLNLMSEDRHTEICAHAFTLWGKDIDRLEEKFDDLEQKVDIMSDKLDLVISSAGTAQEYAKEMKKMSDLISDISNKLSRAWKMDGEKRQGVVDEHS